MDLWIRSQQNTTLVKVKDLHIREDINDYACIVANQESKNSFTLIGQYTTKERALQILSDIQNKLDNNILKYDKEGNPTLVDNILVYQMPE